MDEANQVLFDNFNDALTEFIVRCATVVYYECHVSAASKERAAKIIQEQIEGEGEPLDCYEVDSTSMAIESVRAVEE